MPRCFFHFRRRFWSCTEEALQQILADATTGKFLPAAYRLPEGVKELARAPVTKFDIVYLEELSNLPVDSP